MKAETIRPGTCKMVNHKVFRIEINICGSVNTHWKLANPANDLLPNPSQVENASMKAKISGPSMKTTRPTSCGVRKPSAVRDSFRLAAFWVGEGANSVGFSETTPGFGTVSPAIAVITTCLHC
jgi:hypothetical protein